MANPIEQGYQTVAVRLAAFVVDKPNGLIQTELLHFDPSFVVIGAKLWKDRANADAGKLPDGTGLASMPIPGPTNFTKNSEVENAETSAIGRALAAIGYLSKNEKGEATYASKEEIDAKKGEGERVSKTSGKPLASAKQKGAIRAMAGELNMSDDELRAFTKDETGKMNSNQLTIEDASKMIDLLKIRIAADGATVAAE